jgi:UDP-xylose/UDP-N-acetylglucosamine transporter B4
LVLTIRKAVSLAISVWYYGNGMTPGLALGAAMVLGEYFSVRIIVLSPGGTILYSLSAAPDIVDEHVDSPIAKKLREKSGDEDAVETGTAVLRDTAVEVAPPKRGEARVRKAAAANKEEL